LKEANSKTAKESETKMTTWRRESHRAASESADEKNSQYSHRQIKSESERQGNTLCHHHWYYVQINNQGWIIVETLDIGNAPLQEQFGHAQIHALI
jgi:hypothetical protein